MLRIIDNLIFKSILPIILYFYEKHVMYRIKNAWGKVHLHNIKNKGENVRIVGYSRFLNPNNLKIGNNVRIGYDCFFFSMGGIEIGDNTIISRQVTIYSSNHNYKGLAIPYDNKYIHKPVKIGKSVWIGMRVLITPGVSIGDGAIVGMGTVVSRNIKAGEIIVGPRQRVIANRDMEKLYKLENNDKIFSKLWPQK